MTVVSAKSFPDPSTLPLVADVQYREPFATRALNRKLRGIVPMGIYKGFLPTPGTGLNVLVSSADSDETTGTASFDIGELYQITVLQQTDVTIAIAAGTTKIVVLQAVYEKGLETYQVNSSSTIQAAEIVLVDSGTALAPNQLELATVTVPAGATQITESMIDLSGRKMQAIGIELSSAIDSDAEEVAANSLAVKNAISHLRDSAPDVLNTIGLLAKALNSDPNFYETINTALAGKMAIDQNGADIEDKAAFLTNLGISGSFFGRLINVQHFSSSGTYYKSAGTTSILVFVQGAGGAGGYAIACDAGYMSGGAGGGAGGFAEKYLSTAPASAVVIVGSGGIATTTSGGTGGQSSFNGTVIARGGGAGSSNASTIASGTVTQQKGGAGGSSSGGDINGIGQMGGWLLNSRTGNGQSGFGAPSRFSGGGSGQGGADAVGAIGYLGSGGSGALGGNNTATAAHAGGNGGDGFVRIYEFG